MPEGKIRISPAFGIAFPLSLKTQIKNFPGQNVRGRVFYDSDFSKAAAALFILYPALTVKLMLPVTSCESEEPPAPSKETIAV